MSIEEVLIAYRSPWQNPFAERLIGSIRRECLDHVIVLGEKHLRRILGEYFRYYHRSRTHLSLEKDCPEPSAVQPPGMGEVVELPERLTDHWRACALVGPSSPSFCSNFSNQF